MFRRMGYRYRSRFAATAIAIVLASGGLVACGGDDTPESAPDESTAQSSNDGNLVDNEVRDVLTDSLGTDEGDDLESAIATLSPETRYSVVAGQLEPEPEVEIDGTDVRFVFSGGSIVEATMACIIGSVVQEETETLTVVYPDGEKTC